MSAGAETGAASSDEQVTFTVKAANDQKFVLTLASTTTVGDLKTKLSGAEYADIPAERIRLIYSGRVLKDPDSLGSAKLKDGHTIHMVKGAASNARQNPGSSSTSTPQNPAANVPTNIAAGTGNNPLAAMTGARYAGFHGLPNASVFGADGGMGPPAGTDEMLRMMDDPNVLQQMNEMMDNPAFQQMMENSPMLQNNPMARHMLRDPNMRRMMFSPQMLRMQLEMQRSMGGGGMGGAGGGAFPAPGVTDTTPQTQGTQEAGATPTPGAPSEQSPTGANPLGGGAAGNPFGAANPFASLFGANPFAAPPAADGVAPTPAAGTGTGAPTTALEQMQQLSQLRQMMGMMGDAAPPRQPGQQQGAPGAGVGAGGLPTDFFSQMFGAMSQGGQAAPADNRPPEDRYADQLRQLNDMGFFEFEKNVQALRQSGGSVQGAVEYLLTHP